MPDKITGRAHAWTGKKRRFCERCGKDQPTDAAEAARKDCRPTMIFF